MKTYSDIDLTPKEQCGIALITFALLGLMLAVVFPYADSQRIKFLYAAPMALLFLVYVAVRFWYCCQYAVSKLKTAVAFEAKFHPADGGRVSN